MAQAANIRNFNTNVETYTLPDIVYTEWDSEIIGMPEKRERVNIVKVAHPETKKARKKAIAAISVITAIFALFAVVIFRYAAIADLGLENRKLETSIEEYGAVIDTLKISILDRSDLRDVQEKAALMGLGFAESSQIRYIELSDNNTHSIAAPEAGSLEQPQ